MNCQDFGSRDPVIVPGGIMNEKSEPLEMPTPEPSGFVKTLNNMGYMTSTLDPYSQQFAEYAAQRAGWSLDIGAAYGVATLHALGKGARIIANDIDPKHVDIIERLVPPEKAKNFKKLPGSFQSLSIEPNTLESILICRVLHFYNGPQISNAVKKFWNWLKPGGRLYIVCETPYLRNFSSFIPIFEERVRAGWEWPGFISDVQAIAPERGAFLPKEMHLLDPQTLTRVCESNGFKTLNCSTIQRTDFPIDIQLDGRESVGYVGEKI